MKLDISAVAFDIDGTLYPAKSFYSLILPFVFRNLKLMSAFGKVRREIRSRQLEKPDKYKKPENFFDFQAELLSKYLSQPASIIREEVKEKIYDGWKPLFKEIKPYKDCCEVIKEFKKHGLKIGILSDLMPEQKNGLWGLLPYCDVVLGSEQTGELKPSKIPFEALSEALGVPCQKILYVGNNKKFDIDGAKSAGMKTAYIRGRLSSFFVKKIKNADISFSTYRQLSESVL